jgi:ribosomal protein S7
VFTHAFDEAMQKVDLNKEIRQKIYTGYDNIILPLFRKLYVATTKLMEDSGLFPDLDEDYITPSEVTKPRQEEKEEVEEQPEEEPEEIEEDEEEDDEDDYEEEQPRRRRRRRRDDYEEDDFDEPPAPPQRRRRTDDVGEAIRNIYSSVRELIGAKGGFEEDYDDDADFFEVEEVQDLLSTLEDEVLNSPGRRMPVSERLLDTASLVGGRRISPRTMQNLEVVENLVDTIEEDSMLTGSSKDWIRQLELTLDKVAAGQDDFLNEKNLHRSLEVVNQLARQGGAESGSAKRAVDEIVREINTNYDENPEIFDQALTKLQPLVERQNRAFTGNVQRTVKASEGQQTLLNAQRAVISEMDQRYAGRGYPRCFTSSSCQAGVTCW